MAQRGKKAAGVELDALALREATCAWQQSLESVGVFLDSSNAATLHQLEQRCRAEGWTKSQVEEFLESSPGRCTFVLLELRVPELRDVVQVVGRHPHAFFRYGAMLAEIGVALVEEQRWISRPIETGEIPPLVFGRVIRKRTSARCSLLPPGDDLDFSCFITAMSACMVAIPAERVFRAARTSARVGSAMVGAAAAEIGDGGELGWWWAAAAVEDCEERVGEDRRDTLSSASMPNVAGPRLRKS